MTKKLRFWAAHFAQGQNDKFQIFTAIIMNAYDHRSFLARLKKSDEKGEKNWGLLDGSSTDLCHAGAVR